MSFTNIKAALINAYISGGFSLSTAYENKKFKAEKNTPWAAVFIVPNQPSVATLGDSGTDAHDGFLQINLNYPPDCGDGEILKKADEIGAYFRAGSSFEYDSQQVTISSCGRSQGNNVDDMYQIILTINWYARVQR